MNDEAIQELCYLIAEAPEKVVYIFGAGLSVPAGIPDWITLIQNLIEKGTAEYKNSNENKYKQLSSIKDISDPWIQGAELEKIIPRNLYINWIRGELGKKSRIENTFYKEILQTNFNGIISFNIDNLCKDYSDFNRVNSSTGMEFNKYTGFLLSHDKWLLQPHGSLAHPDSWVFSLKKRDSLLRSKKYREFIKNVLQSKRLVLWGFNPRDISFNSLLLDDFRSDMCESSAPHFWIRRKLEKGDIAWCDNYNIVPIEYKATDKDHSNIFKIISSLKTAEPRKDKEFYEKFDNDNVDLGNLPEDISLGNKEPEIIRNILDKASRSLYYNKSKSNIEEVAQKYIEFTKKYPASLHKAWLITTEGEYNKFFKYKIKDEIGGGAFGRIYKAYAPGEQQASVIKVLREEYINNYDFIQAFRRGVFANKILTQRKIKGMVTYKSNFEVPPSMIMDYINGPTLDEAVKNKTLADLVDVIYIYLKIISIINDAHSCKERVLHRDLKPTNVMLEDFYSSPDDMNVIILDFDLSWYEGALGKSVVSGTPVHGYAAPEQIGAHGYKKQSTRKTAVDVYGLGMLLYFMVTREDPHPALLHSHSFFEEAEKKFQSQYKTKLKGIYKFIIDKIKESTKIHQDKRIPLDVLMREISDLYLVLERKKCNLGGNYVFYELGCGIEADFFTTEKINSNECHFRYEEIEILMKRLNSNSFDGCYGIKLNLIRTTGAATDRKKKGKYLRKWGENAASKLRKDKIFKKINTEIRKGQVEVIGIIEGDEIDLPVIQKAGQLIFSAALSLMGD